MGEGGHQLSGERYGHADPAADSGRGPLEDLPTPAWLSALDEEADEPEESAEPTAEDSGEWAAVTPTEAGIPPSDPEPVVPGREAEQPFPDRPASGETRGQGESGTVAEPSPWGSAGHEVHQSAEHAESVEHAESDGRAEFAGRAEQPEWVGPAEPSGQAEEAWPPVGESVPTGEFAATRAEEPVVPPAAAAAAAESEASEASEEFEESDGSGKSDASDESEESCAADVPVAPVAADEAVPAAPVPAAPATGTRAAVPAPEVERPAPRVEPPAPRLPPALAAGPEAAGPVLPGPPARPSVPPRVGPRIGPPQRPRDHPVAPSAVAPLPRAENPPPPRVDPPAKVDRPPQTDRRPQVERPAPALPAAAAPPPALPAPAGPAPVRAVPAPDIERPAPRVPPVEPGRGVAALLGDVAAAARLDPPRTAGTSAQRTAAPADPPPPEGDPWPHPAPPPRDLRDDRPLAAAQLPPPAADDQPVPVPAPASASVPPPASPSPPPPRPVWEGPGEAPFGFVLGRDAGPGSAPVPGPVPGRDVAADAGAAPRPDDEPDPDLEPDPFPAAAYAGEDNTTWHSQADAPWLQDAAPADPGAAHVIRFQGEDAWDEPLRRPPLFRRLVIITVVFAVLIAAFVVLAFVKRGGDGDKESPPSNPPSPPASATAGRPAVLPAAAPNGWSRTAAWTAVVAPPTARAATIASGTTAVAVITPTKQVAILDPADGRVRRSFDLPKGEHRGVKLGVVDGTMSVLVHAGDVLAYAPADGSAAPTTLDVAADAVVSYAGDSPLIVNGTGVQVVRDGKLADVQLPPGATAMAADGANVIAAVPVGPWWNAAPGREATAITPAPPRPGATLFRIAAAGHNRVAVVWTGPDAATVTVVLYDATTGEARITADAPLEEMRKTAWVWGTDGQVAALGPLVFDVKGGKAAVRSGFGPVIGWGNLLYGQTAADPQTAVVLDATDPKGAPVPLGSGVPLPWGGPTGQLILILDTAPSTAPTLYALTREGTPPGSPGQGPSGSSGSSPGPAGTTGTTGSTGSTGTTT